MCDLPSTSNRINRRVGGSKNGNSSCSSTPRLPGDTSSFRFQRVFTAFHSTDPKEASAEFSAGSGRSPSSVAGVSSGTLHSRDSLRNSAASEGNPTSPLLFGGPFSPPTDACESHTLQEKQYYKPQGKILQQQKQLPKEVLLSSRQYEAMQASSSTGCRHRQMLQQQPCTKKTSPHRHSQTRLQEQRIRAQHAQPQQPQSPHRRQQQQQQQHQEGQQQMQGSPKGTRRRARRGVQRHNEGGIQKVHVGAAPQTGTALEFRSAHQEIVSQDVSPRSSIGSRGIDGMHDWPHQCRSTPVGASSRNAIEAAEGDRGPRVCHSAAAAVWGLPSGMRAPTSQGGLTADKQEYSIDAASPGAPAAACVAVHFGLAVRQPLEGPLEEQLNATQLSPLKPTEYQWRDIPLQAPALAGTGGPQEKRQAFWQANPYEYGGPRGPHIPVDIPQVPNPHEDAPEWGDAEAFAAGGPSTRACTMRNPSGAPMVAPAASLLGAPAGAPVEGPVETVYGWSLQQARSYENELTETQQDVVEQTDVCDYGSDSSCSCCHYDCSSRECEDESRRSSYSSGSGYSSSHTSEEERTAADNGEMASVSSGLQQQDSEETQCSSSSSSSMRRPSEELTTDHWKIQGVNLLLDIAALPTEGAAVAAAAGVLSEDPLSPARRWGSSRPPRACVVEHQSQSSAHPCSSGGSRREHVHNSSRQVDTSCKDSSSSGSSSRELGSGGRRRRPQHQSSDGWSREGVQVLGLKRLRKGPRGAVLEGGTLGAPPRVLKLRGSLQDRMVIFDWDDTFFPNSWVAARGLSLLSAPCEYIEAAPLLQRLTRSGAKLLQAARCVGSVVLVTNAAPGWIEETCQRFLPALWPTVQAMRRTSARFHFDGLQNESPFLWKRLAFRDEVDRHLKEFQHCPTVLSVGDGPHERDALFFIYGEGKERYKFTCKSLKLIDTPSLKHLNIQHSLLLHTLEDLLGHEGHLDLCVKFPQYGDSQASSRTSSLEEAETGLRFGGLNQGDHGLWNSVEDREMAEEAEREAVRLLNTNWRRCSRSAASLMHIDVHSGLSAEENHCLLPH